MPTIAVTFSPDSLFANSPITVTMAVTGGSYQNIYYTTDGSTPTTSSTVYSSPVSVAVSPTTTLKAFATGLTGFENSPVKTASYGLIFGTTGNTWSNNVVVNGGVAPSSNSIWAVDQFWSGCHADGIDTAAIAVNIFAPDNLTACLTPIIYNSGSQPWVNHNFVSGDLGGNGLTGNGSTKYLDTGVNASTSGLVSTEGCIGVYVHTLNSASTGTDIGNIVGSPSFLLIANYNNSGLTHIFDCYGQTSGSGRLIDSSATQNGFYIGNRTAANSQILYVANSSNPNLVTVLSSSGSGTTPPNSTLLPVFALNLNGSISQFANSTISLVWISHGLSTPQSLYNRSQSLRIALGGGYR
jgi:hypothetical protein